MAHAILRGANGRRHEVDFGDAEVTIEVYAGETTIEVVIDAPTDLSHRKRFALLTFPSDEFSGAPGHAAQTKRANKTSPVAWIRVRAGQRRPRGCDSQASFPVEFEASAGGRYWSSPPRLRRRS